MSQDEKPIRIASEALRVADEDTSDQPGLDEGRDPEVVAEIRNAWLHAKERVAIHAIGAAATTLAHAEYYAKLCPFAREGLDHLTSVAIDTFALEMDKFEDAA